MPSPKSDLPGIALVKDRRDFFRSLISAISSSIRESRAVRARVTTVAGLADLEGSGLAAVFSSSAAVISHAGFLNKLKRGRTETDRVLKVRASLPRALFMLSGASLS